MRYRGIASFVCVSMMALSGAAHAQLAPPFDECKALAADMPSAADSPVSSEYGGCLPAADGDSYADIFVRLKPPVAKGAEGLARKEKKTFLTIARALFLPQTKSGSILLKLDLVTAQGTTVPLDIINIASFSADEKKGLTTTSDTAVLSNEVGYRFKVSAVRKIRATILYAYERSNTPTITDKLAFFLKYRDVLRYVPKLDADLIEPLRKAEADLVAQFAIDNARTKTVELDFGADNINAFSYAIGLDGLTSDPGRMTVGLQRRQSVLVDNLEKTGLHTFDAHITRLGDDISADITGRMIGADTLHGRIATLMGADFVNLTSTDPAAFEAACVKLKAAVQDSALGLTPQDQTIATWSLYAPSPNIVRADLRATSCFKAIEVTNGQFTAYGLPLPPIEQAPLNDHYAGIVTSAQEAARRTGEKVVAAQERGEAGKSAALNVAMPGNMDGYVRRAMVYGYLYQGTDPAKSEHLVGTYEYLSGDNRGDLFAGDMVMMSGVPVAEGLGRFTFDPQRTAEDRLSYQGEFHNNMFQGLGQMQWRDGRVFVGNFANDKPNGLGVMRWPDGRMQFGSFADGKLANDGVERAADGRNKAGYWVAGVAQRIY